MNNSIFSKYIPKAAFKKLKKHSPKKDISFDIYKIFNEYYYTSVYSEQLEGKTALDHYISNYETLEFDPAPELSLVNISRKYPKLSSIKILEKLSDKESFYKENITISASVLNYFNIQIDERLIHEIELLKNEVDASFYTLCYPDVSRSWIPPYIHFALFGYKERRKPNEWFDTEYYMRVNVDVAESNMNPFIHYLLFGKTEGRPAHPKENNDSYTYYHDPLDFAIDTITTTENESDSSVVFDKSFYLKNNPDVQEAGLDPFSHFISNGESEDRMPNEWFSPSFYRSVNADVRVAGISPFQHFCNFGRPEGRLGISPQIQGRASHQKPLLFVGHDGIQAGAQAVLLEIVKWFYEHTTRRIKVLLLNPGIFASEYTYYADTYTLNQCTLDDIKDFSYFLNDDFEFIYINTVVSGKILSLISEHDIALRGRIVCHIHEMKAVLAENIDQINHLLTCVSHWISASPASTETLINTYGIQNSSISTIPAFIRNISDQNNDRTLLRDITREELGIDRKTIVIAGCGTICTRKGTDIFVDVAEYILSIYDEQIEFIWIGDGIHLNEFKDRLESRGINSIKFLGHRTDANRLLASADLFFLSSREDPFPLVVLESAQHGIPTICYSESTGITDFIEEDAGICLPNMDIRNTAQEIIRLISTPSILKALGQRAKDKLLSAYTANKQCKNIFFSLINNSILKPSVSIIVPFYNHELFANDRINSILNQSIQDFELILLDDFSQDNTKKIVQNFTSDPRISFQENKFNSGSPFKQWQKGIILTNTNLVWIAEGDDSCSDNFLETLLPYFDDPMVNIASAKTEIIDDRGNIIVNALNPYLETAFPKKFRYSYINDGFKEVNEQLGSMCTLVNASGLILRKKSLSQDILQRAETYKIAGDWLIYLSCLKHGKIAYDINATNYFRRHSQSQVHKVEGTEIYFRERFEITSFMVNNFTITNRILKKSFDSVNNEWARFKHLNINNKFEELYNTNSIISKADFVHNKKHIAFYVHGFLFSKGGIERLVSKLANHLVEKGWKVTIFCRKHSNTTPIFPIYGSVIVKPIFQEQRSSESIENLRANLAHSDIDIFVPMLSEALFEPIVQAAQDTGVLIIASEHNDPWKIEELWWPHNDRINCFDKVDSIHLLMNCYKNSLPEELQKKVHVIHNGIHVNNNTSWSNREKLFISVGRLEEQKRFDRLISAVNIAQDTIRSNNYRIEIYGEGSLRASLSSQIKDNDIGDIIILKGQTHDIESVYKIASAFILPSEFEGMPMTLLEAMSFSLPSVAFAECNGCKEIIRHGTDGLLVGDIKELSDAIVQLCSSIDKQMMGQHAHNRSKDFTIDKFFRSWVSLLSTAMFNTRNLPFN
jgi:glycosyltransferase involved in cell wall biosynthesis